MEKKKSESSWKILVTIIVTAFITFILTSVGVIRIMNNNENYYIKNSKTETSSLETTLKNFKNVLEKKYIGEINEEKMIDSAIKGYIAGLGDPYTEYIPKAKMEEYKQNLMGNYVGIGIYMAKNTENNTIVVLTPIKYILSGCLATSTRL